MERQPDELACRSAAVPTERGINQRCANARVGVPSAFCSCKLWPWCKVGGAFLQEFSSYWSKKSWGFYISMREIFYFVLLHLLPPQSMFLGDRVSDTLANAPRLFGVPVLCVRVNIGSFPPSLFSSSWEVKKGDMF